MRWLRSLLGMFVILVAANGIAWLITITLYSPDLYLFKSFNDSLSFNLFVISMLLFVATGLSGFRMLTGRLPGDKNPDHYQPEMRAGGDSGSLALPLLLSAIVVFIESAVIALI